MAIANKTATTKGPVIVWDDELNVKLNPENLRIFT
jgi:hypothetical protein